MYLIKTKMGTLPPPPTSNSLTTKKISKWGIIQLLAFLFIAASPLQAGITWDTGLQVIDVDMCGKFAHLQAFSQYGPQEGRLDLTLEVNAGTKANPNWQVVQQDSYPYLEGQYDFFIDGNTIALPIGNRQYRVFFEFTVSDTDPMGHWNGEYLTGYSEQDVWVHFLYYPTPPELYVNELTDAAGPYLVANCGTAVYDLIFNYDFEAEYTGTYTIYESDANENQVNVITSRQQQNGPIMNTFFDLIQDMKNDFSNLLDPTYTGFSGYTGYNGYILIVLDIDHAYGCLGSHERKVHIKINEQPYVSDFVFRYLDTISNPTGPTYIIQTPSQDPFNPTEVGGLTGEMVSQITTPFYDYWEMKIEWIEGTTLTPYLVGFNFGSTILANNFNQLLSGAAFNFTSSQVGGATDAPIHNPDETYKFTLTVGTQDCGDDSFSGYFTVPAGLVLNKTDFTINQTTNGLFEVSFESKAIEDNEKMNANIYNVAGQLIEQVTFSQEKATFSGTLPMGMYLVQVVDSKGNTLWTSKAIK